MSNVTNQYWLILTERTSGVPPVIFWVDVGGVLTCRRQKGNLLVLTKRHERGKSKMASFYKDVCWCKCKTNIVINISLYLEGSGPIG